MKYVEAEKLSELEILKKLSSDLLSPNERIETVLSALYYTDHKFAGDLLITEFENAKYAERIFLKNLFPSFVGIQRSVYRADEMLALLEKYKGESPEHSKEIEGTIEDLKSDISIFK